MKTVTASGASRHFSGLLRHVASGAVITVLLRGKPVAVIGPARSACGQREAAKFALLERLRQQQQIAGARHWARDELYGP
jgi:prevent-host-death family protein